MCNRWKFGLEDNGIPLVLEQRLMIVGTAPWLGSNQNTQMDDSPMQCHDGQKPHRRFGMGGTGCQRPTFPVLGMTDLWPSLG